MPTHSYYYWSVLCRDWIYCNHSTWQNAKELGLPRCRVNHMVAA